MGIGAALDEEAHMLASSWCRVRHRVCRVGRSLRQCAEIFVACPVALIFTLGILVCTGPFAVAQTKDRSQWADAPPERKKWFESREINEAARQRLGVKYMSCCDNGDVFRTRFRVVDDGTRHGLEQWQYLDGNVWKAIPDDVIKQEPSLDNQPILFKNRWTGEELCFFKPNGGM